MIEANVEVLKERLELLRDSAITEARLLGQFMANRAQLVAAGEVMSNVQKVGVLGLLTDLQDMTTNAKTSVDEAFNANSPL